MKHYGTCGTPCLIASMMPLKRERWASIRSLGLYHNTQKQNRINGQRERKRKKFLPSIHLFALPRRLCLTVQYGRNRDIREWRINALVRGKPSLKQSHLKAMTICFYRAIEFFLLETLDRRELLIYEVCRVALIYRRFPYQNPRSSWKWPILEPFYALIFDRRH